MNSVVDKQKVIELAAEWEEIWKTRPFENSNGLGCQGAFALYYFLKEMDPAPELVVECGTWRGFSTWVIRMAVPDAKIICSDPILASRQFLKPEVFTPEYRVKDAEYTWQDFSNIEINIPEEKKERAVVFFDDHQNKIPRLEQAIKKGFKHIVYDDNVPYKYTHTSFEYLFDVEKDTSVKKYFERYEIFPPIYSGKHKSGIELNGILEKEMVDLRSFVKERNLYSWVTKVEVSEFLFNEKISFNSSRDKRDKQYRKKIIHVCFNNMHVQPLVNEVDDINNNAKYKHEIYIERNRSIPNYDVDISKSKDAIYFDEKECLSDILKKCLAEEVEGVIFHGLFFEWQKRLVKSIGDHKKTIWVMWGGDLYNPVAADFIDISIYENFDAVSTSIEGDYNFFLKNYTDKPLIPYKHASSISLEDAAVLPEDKENSVIIGNSGDPSNQHLDIIQAINNKADKESFSYILPMAYNMAPGYLDNIKNALLDAGVYKKCSFIEQMLPPQEYFSIVAKSKGMITAHNRQQAVGNISASLYFENFTVLRERYFVRGEYHAGSVWENLKKKGVEGVFSFEEFYAANKISDFLDFEKSGKNKEIIKSEFDGGNYLNAIKEMEDRIENL
ncbi:hypothetical protein AWR38_28940 [Idiomarina sp. WRN-38]|nr:hypothetical protein AUR68_28900 [Idiomarina sp. H105]OAF04999.1 hypothetical protein AWR38_28940 [Idiomarina sp. WRN-38]